MAERQWTDKQQLGFSVRGGTLLVAAAAGSGKTAVLVERVLRMITDKEKRIGIDRLLIVTFTRAAAAEMRQRIAEALAERAAQEPENEWLQQQQMLLPQAPISTIDSFCADLLREFGAGRGLPLRFRIAEPEEAKLLEEEALEAVLEESYRKKEPGFLLLTSRLESGRSDEALRKTVRQAYSFMQAQPFPERWLAEQTSAYTAQTPLEETRWMDALRQELRITLASVLSLEAKALRLCQSDEMTGYRHAFEIENRQLEKLVPVLETGTYDELLRAFSAFHMEKLVSFPRTKDPVITELRERVRKNIHMVVADQMKYAVSLFAGDEEACRNDLRQMAPAVAALGDLVSRFSAEYTRRKRQKSLLDYNDLSHEALPLLIEQETGKPTPLAFSLSARYEEILVDEYQDTNKVQDALFSALSRQEQNLFFVGDVKQSIYGFRQAMPQLFIQRREMGTEYDEHAPCFPATVTLENNFRSRPTVTDTVNFLFRQLMHRDLGGVQYDEREALVCSARYPQQTGTQTEYILVNNSKTPWDKETAEARIIGKRIRELMGSMTVWEKGNARPLRYRDICILVRSRIKIASYLQELTAMGIPAGADSTGSLLESSEVMTAVSLLRVIDNPLREIELTSVMLSPIFGFTPDDCARLRPAKTASRMPLYSAVEQYGESSTDELSSRCRRLITCLRHWRALAVYMPADDLLERLYRDTAMPSVYAVGRGGQQRVANLRRLETVARSFEQGEFRGSSAFVRFLDRLEEQREPIAAADTFETDSVRIMTIHNSKGLEFPVVFLARLHGKFNQQDSRSKLLFHQQAGIGLRWKDEQEKYRTLPFSGVLSARTVDSRAEELRVWYVAMTRAKEKLIMMITADDPIRLIQRLEDKLTPFREIPAYALLKANSPAEWFLMAALRHPCFAHLRHYPEETLSLSAQEDCTVFIVTPAEEEPLASVPEAIGIQPDEQLAEQLRQRLRYTYPLAGLARIPAKAGVSTLSHSETDKGRIAAARPAFLQAGGLTPAQRGTALHTFMQFADYQAAQEDPAAEAQRLTEKGFLTAEQLKALNIGKIARFFAGTLYRRIAASPACYREYHFSFLMPAAEIAPDVAGVSDESVVVQGIADCVFREDDHLVLVDYKTDRTDSPEELTERYYRQLSIYKKALETIFGLPITESLLYSFHYDKEIRVE